MWTKVGKCGANLREIKGGKAVKPQVRTGNDGSLGEKWMPRRGAGLRPIYTPVNPFFKSISPGIYAILWISSLRIRENDTLPHYPTHI
jgi:hypothetical protein